MMLHLLAQVAAATGVTTETDPNVGAGWTLGLSFYEMMSPLLLALLGWLSKHAATWLSAETKNKKLASVLVRLNETVWTLVMNAEQTMVREIKAKKDPKSPGGTDITVEEGKEIKVAVLAQFKELWGTKGLTELMGVLGLDSTEAVMDYVSKKVEATVAGKAEEHATPFP